MDEARTGPGGGSGAMGDGADPTQGEASANRGLRDRAKESVRDAREKAMTQVRERTDGARQSATRMVDERKRTLADSVHALASAFDAAADSLGQGQQSRLAEWTRELSGRAHRMASYLDEQDTRGLVSDLEDTARRNPTAFLGTTFAAGLAAGRFLRATQRTDTAIESGTDIDFHPEAALLADDRPEATSFSASTGASPAGLSGTQGLSATDRESLGGGYGNPGSGYGTTGSNVGATRSGLGDQGFGPTVTGTTRGLSGAGHIGTGGAALASRAAGSAPIGKGTGGLNDGGVVGDAPASKNFEDDGSSDSRSGGA